MKKLLLFASLIAIPLLSYGQTLLSEDFQTGVLPATWSKVSTNAAFTWHVEDPLAGTAYKATVNYDPAPAAQNELLVTPSLDFTVATNFTLKTDVSLSYYWSVTPFNNYDVSIVVSTDNGTTWTTVWTENDLGVFGNFVDIPVTINLSPYAGNSNVKIGFKYVGNDGAAFYVDNVSVKVASNTPPNCATPVSPANMATGINYTTAPLSWTAPTTGSEVNSYDIYLDTNANPATLIGNSVGTTFNATGLMASTTYYWKAVAKNAAGSATGCSVFSFTTAAPTYCTAGATSTSFEKISSVTFANINNPSTAPAGYEDFTSVVGNVMEGSTYTFTATAATSYDDDQVLVWIDFNNDKDFTDAGEEVLVTATSKSPWTGSITIPTGVAAGQVRMRVRMHDSVLTPNVTPCGTSSFGQVEDYTLNITQLAVSDVNKSQVKVYPNPVVDVLNINADSKVSSVQVFDLAGKLVSSQILNSVKNKVNLAQLKSGVYVVNIETEKGIESVKIIKK